MAGENQGGVSKAEGFEARFNEAFPEREVALQKGSDNIVREIDSKGNEAYSVRNLRTRDVEDFGRQPHDEQFERSFEIHMAEAHRVIDSFIDKRNSLSNVRSFAKKIRNVAIAVGAGAILLQTVAEKIDINLDQLADRSNQPSVTQIEKDEAINNKASAAVELSKEGGEN